MKRVYFSKGRKVYCRERFGNLGRRFVKKCPSDHEANISAGKLNVDTIPESERGRSGSWKEVKKIVVKLKRSIKLKRG